MDKTWFRIIELVLLAVIAAVLIVGQFLPTNAELDHNPEQKVYNDIVNLVQWPVSHGGNDHWYGVLNKEVYWEQALVEAEAVEINSQRGYLATVTSLAENEFIRTEVISQTNQPSIFDAFWLGGHNVEGSWQWISGEPFDFEHWSAYEPNNIELETALSMWGPSHWDTQQQPGQWNNLLPNSEINRVYRIWAVVEFGRPAEVNSTSAGNPQNDAPIRTKPATRVISENRPTNTLLNLTQWPSAEGGNDHWYAILAPDSDWEGALKATEMLSHQGMPGHLASISSEAENSFIIEKVIRDYNAFTTNDQYWIGGSRINKSWQWLTGEPMDYTNWAPGEPNKHGLENALAIYGPFCPTNKGRSTGKWNNAPSNSKNNPLACVLSIIEFEPALSYDQ